MKALIALATVASLLGGCATPDPNNPMLLAESDLRSMGGGYEYTPTVQVEVDEPEVDYERLYRKWKVQDSYYGGGPRWGRHYGRR